MRTRGLTRLGPASWARGCLVLGPRQTMPFETQAGRPCRADLLLGFLSLAFIRSALLTATWLAVGDALTPSRGSQLARIYGPGGLHCGQGGGNIPIDPFATRSYGINVTFQIYLEAEEPHATFREET